MVEAIVASFSGKFDKSWFEALSVTPKEAKREQENYHAQKRSEQSNGDWEFDL